MKHSIIIFLFLWFSFSFAQDKKVILQKMTCESGTEQAIKDASDGIYKSITYGLVASTDWDFDKFYWNFAKEKYNIILGTGGCVMNDEILCYSRKMKELIDEKFGEGFLDNVKKEARLAYGKTKNTK